MPRKKKGTNPGRTSAFSGEKLTWLESFEDDFRTKERGEFYDYIAKSFLTRYGYDLGFGDNVEGSMDDWVPVNRRAGLEGEELEKEKDFEDDVRKALRTKLSNWYRHKYEGKRLHGGALKQILKRMHILSSSKTRPRRKTNLAIYSNKFYATKLKAGFDTVWNEAKETLPASHRVSLCQEYVKNAWDAETPEFRAALNDKADEEHSAAMKEFRRAEELSTYSAEAYHEALKSLDDVGIPLADALSERLGMHVVIMAVGPVGEQSGEVRLRSIFSDTSGGQTAKVWGEFDRAGFTAAEVSLTRWGRAFYSKAECRQRAWPAVGEGPNLDDLLMIDTPTNAAAALPPVSPPPAPGAATSTPVPPPPAATAAAAAMAPGSAAEAATEGMPIAPPAARGRFEWNWTQTQKDAYDLMVGKEWGPRWKELIKAMVLFEEGEKWDNGTFDRYKGKLRPEEFGQWMKEHRKGGDYEKILPGFGERLLLWWRAIGPEFRGAERPEDLPAEQEWPPRQSRSDEEWCWHDWTGVRIAGNNGMLLLCLGLAWWGQKIVSDAAGDGIGAGEAALTADAAWQYMLEDVLYTYAMITDELGKDDLRILEIERQQELDDGEAGEVEAETSGKKGETSGKKGKNKVAAKKAEGKKKAPPIAAAKAPAKRGSRKRAREEEDDEEAVGGRETRGGTVTVQERPKPKPLHKKRKEDGPAVNEGDGVVQGEQGDLTDIVGNTEEGGEEGGAMLSGNGDVEMERPALKGASTPGEQQPGEEEPFSGDFDDPFGRDETEGMTAEELADYKAEMMFDGEAEKEGGESADEGED